MAAVNFYRFASAVMELLNPRNEPGQINSLEMVNTESSPAFNVSSSDKNAVATQTLSAALSNDSIVSANSPSISEIKADVETVEAVAAHLTKALETASQDKINTVAQALETVVVQAQNEQAALSNTTETNLQKQVLVETFVAVKEAAINANDQAENKPNVLSVVESVSQKAATFVQAAVETIAKQTVKEVKSNSEAKAAQAIGVDVVVSSEIKISADEVKATVEKAIQNQETLANSVDPNIGNVENTTVKETSISSLNSPITDFWETYQEADPADIKYEGLMRYAYSYMTRNSLLDTLNPEIEISNRRNTMFEAFGNANNELVMENNRYSNFERDANELLNNLRESGYSPSGDSRNQTELEYRQRAERQRLEQKLAQADTKQSKDDIG